MSSTAGGEDKKEISEHINLKVTNNENGGEVYFKIKRTAPLEKLMKAYCDRIGTNVANMRFLFDGERLNPSQTPNDLDMQDEDVIDAMLEQVGGGRTVI